MACIFGTTKKIDLSSSLFERSIREGNLYIDKTRFVEHFLNEPNAVQLIVRQRRLGKTMNLDMLRCFLTDSHDYRYLFKGLYIENSSVWNMANSATVFVLDFKNLNKDNYKSQVNEQLNRLINIYIDIEKLPRYLKSSYQSFERKQEVYTDGIRLLTEMVYEMTGKCSYIIIDEYDKPLNDNYGNDCYDEIKEFETLFLSSGLKSNPYLQKALLTGVTRVSRESILSGLNNLQTYDLFSDELYKDDFGLTESEIDELQSSAGFDKSVVKDWYNGIKISGSAIYNIFSVLSCIKYNACENYWGRSGTIDIIGSLLNGARMESISKLLNGEAVQAVIDRRISLKNLTNEPDDSVFYSLLVQTGYLSLESVDTDDWCSVKIPNKELMNVWRIFILTSVVKNSTKVKTLFDNISNLDKFDRDIEYFLSDRLSYFDLETDGKEKIYHVFVLGLISAYEGIHYKRPLSNRESGDGRYDILFEKDDLYIIFEFKSVSSVNEVEISVFAALHQIDEKRYFAGLAGSKKLIKSAVVFCGKQCFVKSVEHAWADTSKKTGG